MGFFSGLGATLSNAAAPLANTMAANLQGQEQARQRRMQEGLAAMAQKRQADQDAQKKALNDAMVANYGARTKALSTPKPDYKGIHVAQDGSAWIVHDDGSISPATVRGAAPTASPPPAAPHADAFAPPAWSIGNHAVPSDSAAGPPQSAGPPIAPPPTQQPTPKFGPREKPAPAPKPEPLKVTVGADGKPIYTPQSQAAGMQAPGPRPPAAPKQGPYSPEAITADSLKKVNAAKVKAEFPSAGGQGGAQVQKARTLADLMENAIPAMDALSAKVRPERITTAVLYPNAGNMALNQDEQSYMLNARTFLAGALHLESGARLSKEQWQIGLERYFPTIGDTPQTKAEKLAAAKKVTADRRREAGGTPSGGGRGGANPDGKPGNINLGGGQTVSPEDAAHAARDPKFASWLRTQGYQVP